MESEGSHMAGEVGSELMDPSYCFLLSVKFLLSRNLKINEWTNILH